MTFSPSNSAQGALAAESRFRHAASSVSPDLKRGDSIAPETVTSNGSSGQRFGTTK